MTFDAHKNLAVTTIATAPSSPTAGTSCTVADGSVLPAVPYYGTITAAGEAATLANSEIVRVTAGSGNTISAMTRGQGGSSARTVLVGDVFEAGLTSEMFAALEAAINANTAAIVLLALASTAVKTSAYTAAPSDLVPVDATSGAVTVTLPTAPADKTRIAVKKIDASLNTVTIARGGSTDVFNKAGGSTSLTISVTNQAMDLQYVAATGIWYLYADSLPLSGLDARYDAGGAASTEAIARAAADALLAPLASPALTGSPTAPTQAARNNSTRLATTAYIDALLPYGGAGILIAGADSASKAKRWADVVLTGSNDDVAINAAIAAMPSFGGKVILAEGDNYTISNPISIAGGGIQLEGIGQRTSCVISCAGANPTAMIEIGASANAFNNAVRHLALVGGSGATGHGIHAASSLFKCEDVWIEGVPQDGVSLYTHNVGTEFPNQMLRDVFVYHAGRDGISAAADCDNLRLNDVICQGSITVISGSNVGRNGFNILSSYARLMGCRADDFPQYGAYFGPNALQAQLIGSHFDENATAGLYGDSNSTGVVSGCSLQANRTNGIQLNGAAPWTITGTEFLEAVTTNAAIALGGGPHIVKGNLFLDHNTYGIILGNLADGTEIDGNIMRQLSGTVTKSIRIFGTNKARVHHNTVSAGISEESTSNNNLIEQNERTGGTDVIIGAGTIYIPARGIQPRTEGRNFVVPGTIAVAAGATNYIPPMFVNAAGLTATLKAVRYVIRAGTSVTFKLQKNGVDMTGFTGLSATTTAATTTPTAVSVADGDAVAVVVTAVSGSPDSLTVELVFGYS